MAQKKLPTIVVQVTGGIVSCVNSSIPVRLLVLDADTDGGDRDRIMEVNGSNAYVHDYMLTGPALVSGGLISDGIEADFVADVAGQVDAAR